MMDIQDPKLLGKRPSVGRSVSHIVNTCEKQWCQWKEEKAKCFEKKSSEGVKTALNKKRLLKEQEKQTRYVHQVPFVKPMGPNLHKGGANLHKNLRAAVDDQSKGDSLKKCPLPSMSDFLYPVLLDCDPAEEVDDEFKNKHN